MAAIPCEGDGLRRRIKLQGHNAYVIVTKTPEGKHRALVTWPPQLRRVGYGERRLSPRDAQMIKHMIQKLMREV